MISRMVGQRRRARGGGAVAEHALQLQHEEQRAAPEPAVDGEGGQVGAGELPVGEQPRREHGEGHPPLAGDEQRPGDHRHDRGHDDVGAAALPGGDEGVGQRTQGHRTQHRTEDVEAAVRAGVAALGHVPPGDEDHEHGQRDVEEEDQPPAGQVDEGAAQERADEPGDPGEGGPHPDRRCPVGGAERGLDERQAAGGEQGPADALQRAGGDQLARGLGEPAQQRRRGEPGDAHEEHPPPAVPVTERAAEQDQRGQRQRVAVDDPLQVRQRGVQVAADRRQRHLHRGGVQERHARGEHGGHEHPPARRGAEGQAGGSRTSDAGHPRSISRPRSR